MHEKEWVLENTSLRLQVCASDRVIKTEFHDKKSGRVLAQGPYLYKLEREVEEGRLTTDSLLFEKGEISRTEAGAKELQITGRIGDLEIIHRFSLVSEKPFLDESFTLYNRGPSSIQIANLRFGFTRLVTDAGGVIDPEFKESRLVAVP